MIEGKVRVGDRVKFSPPNAVVRKTLGNMNSHYWKKEGTVVEISRSCSNRERPCSFCLAGGLMKVRFDDGTITGLGCWSWSNKKVYHYLPFKVIEKLVEVDGFKVRIMN